jgi:hypothetical protein
MTTDKAKLVGHIDEALDHLLAVRAGLGIDDVPEPASRALDAAFTEDETARAVRRGVQQALEHLRTAEGDEAREAAFYAAEEAVNHLVSVLLDLGFAVGFTAGRRGR